MAGAERAIDHRVDLGGDLLAHDVGMTRVAGEVVGPQDRAAARLGQLHMRLQAAAESRHAARDDEIGIGRVHARLADLIDGDSGRVGH